MPLKLSVEKGNLSRSGIRSLKKKKKIKDNPPPSHKINNL